jgi:hypothetical protein
VSVIKPAEPKLCYLCWCRFWPPNPPPPMPAGYPPTWDRKQHVCEGCIALLDDRTFNGSVRGEAR